MFTTAFYVCLLGVFGVLRDGNGKEEQQSEPGEGCGFEHCWYLKLEDAPDYAAVGDDLGSLVGVYSAVSAANATATGILTCTVQVVWRTY